MTSVAAQLSRTADCFSRARFRGYTDFVDASLALSRLIVRENLEIYSVPFFFPLYDSRDDARTISYKISCG